MPTAKPRITITLSESQYSVLSSLARLQKVSMSAIVVDLLDTTLPVLERLAGVLENASTAPQHVLDEIRRSAESAENDVASMGSSVMDLLDGLVEKSSGDDATARAARRGAAPEAEPPATNRGVRISSPNAKIATISPMKKGEKNERAEK